MATTWYWGRYASRRWAHRKYLQKERTFAAFAITTNFRSAPRTAVGGSHRPTRRGVHGHHHVPRTGPRRPPLLNLYPPTPRHLSPPPASWPPHPLPSSTWAHLWPTPSHVDFLTRCRFLVELDLIHWCLGFRLSLLF